MRPPLFERDRLLTIVLPLELLLLVLLVDRDLTTVVFPRPFAVFDREETLLRLRVRVTPPPKPTREAPILGGPYRRFFSRRP